LTFVRFADEWTTYLPAGAFDAIRADLGVRYAVASAPLIALSAGGVVGFFFEVAADYVSRRWLSAAGALVYGAAMIAFGLAHSIWLMTAAAFVWGAASDAFAHGSEVALVDLAGDELPKALAKVNFWSSIGDLLGPITLAAASALALGWRGACVGLGLMMLGYAMLLASQRFPPPHAGAHRTNPFVGVLAVLGDRRVIALAIVMGLFGLLDEPLAAFLIAFSEHVRREPAVVANGLILAWTLGGLAALAAYDRIVGERRAARLVVASATVVALALPLGAFAPWLGLRFAAVALFGAAGAVFYVTLNAEVLALRPGQAGSVGATVSLIGMLGMGFPALVGAVADAFGLGAGLLLYALIPLLILPLAALSRR